MDFNLHSYRLKKVFLKIKLAFKCPFFQPAVYQRFKSRIELPILSLTTLYNKSYNIRHCKQDQIFDTTSIKSWFKLSKTYNFSTTLDIY